MKTTPVYRFFFLGFYACICLYANSFSAFAQCLSSVQLYQKVIAIEKESEQALPAAQKLVKLTALLQSADRCQTPKDSSYARLLHRIGVMKWGLGFRNEAIAATLASVRINTSGAKDASRQWAVNSCYNLGYYYAATNQYDDALVNYDQCVTIGKNYTDAVTEKRTLDARNSKSLIYYQTGDFQKAGEELALALKQSTALKDTARIVELLNRQALNCAALHQFSDAVISVNKAAHLIGSNLSAMADNYKIKAIISEASYNYKEAIAYHNKAIGIRTKAFDTATLAEDYLDAGNTARSQAIHQNSGDYSEALRYYTKSLQLSQLSENAEVVVKATNNLSEISFRKKNYTAALDGYHSALLQVVGRASYTGPLSNPIHRQCNAVSDKNFLSMLLANKTESLLYLYKQTGDKKYLTASVHTALLTDSLITDMRHEQTGEQSKLYWRNETRDFFTTAIEASYLAKDASTALYFMEKSRAVLLNDKLNELGAAAHLPSAEAAEEQKLQINVFWQQQKLAGLAIDDAAYKQEELKLFSAREDLQRYINTLQTKYPTYYQYKYADAVPTLTQLQRYLSANGQSFVHYFVSDSAVYALAITPSSNSFLKQAKANVNADLSRFMATCADRQSLNSNYGYFASQANNLYNLLVQPLALPKASVIVCNDGVTVPFEAFTTDANGKNFLVNDYRFSYVYSAQTLLKQFTNPSGKGNFLGVAPVSYAASLSVPPLQQSAAALQNAAAFYSGTKLVVNTSANRANLLNYLPQYAIVTVLSHARADSTDKEPILFMADSIIRLSELQLLRNPAAKLIVLSACQTNAGKLATGEGVFSLTRGFAAAGIPSVVATLWKADENAIYQITELFLKNIAAGMRKDEALQQAKLAFIKSNVGKASLPFYWANMVLAGNTEPVELTSASDTWWWIAGGGLLALLLALLISSWRKKARHTNLKKFTQRL